MNKITDYFYVIIIVYANNQKSDFAHSTIINNFLVLLVLNFTQWLRSIKAKYKNKNYYLQFLVIIFLLNSNVIKII